MPSTSPRTKRKQTMTTKLPDSDVRIVSASCRKPADDVPITAAGLKDLGFKHYDGVFVISSYEIRVEYLSFLETLYIGCQAIYCITTIAQLRALLAALNIPTRKEG